MLGYDGKNPGEEEVAPGAVIFGPGNQPGPQLGATEWTGLDDIRAQGLCSARADVVSLSLSLRLQYD